MNTLKKIFTVAVCSLLSISFTNAQSSAKGKENDAQQKLSLYPKAKEGMKRYVIFLNEAAEEGELKLELIPGKTMSVDCNKHGLAGELEMKNLDGYGYSYYEFSTNGNIMSTQKMCIDSKLTNKFISGETAVIRYNSKLPVVIYAPKGYEVKYRIWKAGKEQSTVQK